MLNLTTTAHYTKGPFLWEARLSIPENHAQCVSVSKIVLELFLQKAKLSLLERTCKKNKIIKINDIGVAYFLVIKRM